MTVHIEPPQQMNIFGRFFWRTYCIEIFPDGDGVGFILNKWHPCSCFFVCVEVIVLLLLSGIPGIKEEWKYNKFGLDYSEYWKKNKDGINLVPRKMK